ncbi:hypothetical protein Mro03_71450 [Microbispora rosea subsp. rosea]|nr:hypothetical protein Mro03_71450 [Microbispora rosea subsp. rosea]
MTSHLSHAVSSSAAMAETSDDPDEDAKRDYFDEVVRSCPIPDDCLLEHWVQEDELLWETPCPVCGGLYKDLST